MVFLSDKYRRITTVEAREKLLACLNTRLVVSLFSIISGKAQNLSVGAGTIGDFYVRFDKGIQQKHCMRSDSQSVRVWVSFFLYFQHNESLLGSV